MSQQSVRQAVRRSALDARAAMLTYRADRDAASKVWRPRC